MKTEVLIPNLIKMINQKQLKKILARKIDDYIHQKIVVENKEDLEMISIRCIAYGRNGGCIYIDWHGNVTPSCAFIPYYVDNIYQLYDNGRTLSNALFSDFMKAGRKWQNEYGLNNWKKPNNWLMPCSIRDHRDHYEIFRNTVLPSKVGFEDEKAKEAIKSTEYFEVMKKYDRKLTELTGKIWKNESLKV